MALSGVSKNQVIPYVPEDDRDSPLEEQTVFWVKPKGFGDGNRTAARYAGCRKPYGSKKGYDEYNPSLMDKADVQEFIACVHGVDNFRLTEDGELIKSTENPDDLRQICKAMSSDLFNEIIDVAGDMSKLKDGEKKSSSSSSTLISGKQKNQNAKKGMSVTTVE